MIHFVGAGCGAADLITVRGKGLLEAADVIIYAGSLVNPALLDYRKESCRVYDSAKMTLEEVLAVMFEAEASGFDTVRLHTGDPCLYGAIREQMDELDKRGVAYDYCPGVSAFSGAAAALKMEYTLPDISQSVVITRTFAAHGATMVLFLSAGLLEKTQAELLLGGYREDTPAAIVYKASWPDEKTCLCTVGTLADCARENGISKIALIIVGDAVKQSGYARSKLYDPTFTTAFRVAKE